MAKNDKIVPAQKQELVVAGGGEIPEYLRRQEGAATEGLEGMEREDLKMPRISLCQSMTPQRKRDDPKYIPGLSEGEWFNTLTGTNFGSELLFVPLLWYKSRILFAPIDEGGGLLCRADDARVGVGTPGGDCFKCPLSRFGVSTDGKRTKPSCNLFHNYIVLVLPKDGGLPRVDGMAALSFKSTGLDAATSLNGLMQMRGARAAYAGVYKLVGASDTNAAGQQYYVPVVSNAGWVSPQLLQIAENAYQSVREMKQMNRLYVDEVTVTDMREPGEDSEQM